MIFDVDAGMANRIPYSALASLDEPADVTLGAEHYVVAARFEDLPHHRLRGFFGGFGWADIPSLRLELAESPREIGSACPASVPLDSAILTSVGIAGRAGHVYAVQREFVGKRLRSQQSTQEFVHIGLSQPFDVFATDLERERSMGYGAATGGAFQGCKGVWMGVQYAKQVDDAGGRLHGAGLVLGEGAGAAADEFAGLSLRQVEALPYGANLLRSDSCFCGVMNHDGS